MGLYDPYSVLDPTATRQGRYVTLCGFALKFGKICHFLNKSPHKILESEVKITTKCPIDFDALQFGAKTPQ